MARAYTDALIHVLERMPPEEKISYTALHIYVEYAQLDMVERILPEYEARIDERDFGAGIDLYLRVPVEQRTQLIRHLTELSAGTVKITATQQDMDT